MTDRELLELAALAAGVEQHERPFFTNGLTKKVGKGVVCWNPLTDDGDALRLAVKLLLTIDVCATYAQAVTPNGFVCEVFASEVDDPYAATRRAIVRAAAEIGRSMKATKE